MSATNRDNSDGEKKSRNDELDSDVGESSDDEASDDEDDVTSDDERQQNGREDDDGNGSEVGCANEEGYYDYEMGKNGDHFDDELSSSRDLRLNGDSQKFSEADGSRMVNSNEWWEGREKLIAFAVLCWCCLCLIIIGVVVGIIMGNRNVEEPDTMPSYTARPTLAPQPLPPSGRPPPTMKPTESMAPSVGTMLSPTTQPTREPTASPTISSAPTKSIPQTLGIFADQDTYINLSGDKVLVGAENGKMDTFLVQNGPLRDETIPDAVALISFPFDEVPAFGRLDGLPKNAILRITHVVPEEPHGSASYTIVRIPETRMAVEYLHGFSFLPPDDEAGGVLVGPSFEVKPSDTEIDIDITTLFFDYKLESRIEPNQLLLMIQNRGAEQEQGGDEFYSRESNSPPQLLVDFAGGNAADIIISEKP
jgi:hypothetical protein